MSWLFEIYLHQFFTFTLVLTRVSGLVMTAPIFGSTDVPARVRALLAVALAVLIAPLQFGVSYSHPTSVIGYLVLIGGELLVGVALGIGIMLLLSGIQLAGLIIGQLSGMQLADVFNPGFDTSVPVFSQILYYVTLAVFVVIGGHRRLIEALLDTYQALPTGAGFPPSFVDAMTTLLGQSFELGVRAAAPAMAALLLATLLLGLVSRTLPQINAMQIGFGINSFITLGMISLSLGAVAWLFQEQIDPALKLIVSALVIR
jgi:flagellar biosynthesis protein FliR